MVCCAVGAYRRYWYGGISGSVWDVHINRPDGRDVEHSGPDSCRPVWRNVWNILPREAIYRVKRYRARR